MEDLATESVREETSLYDGGNPYTQQHTVLHLPSLPQLEDTHSVLLDVKYTWKILILSLLDVKYKFF